MNIREGYIKFSYQWKQIDCNIPDKCYNELNKRRDKLYNLNLIGAYENGIGFGNISMRIPGSNKFYISSSGTGKYKKLLPKHYALVTGFNFNENSINCTGLHPASSESLTHAAVYESLYEVNAVVHIHHLKLWKKLKNKFPTTNPLIEYGTSDMAFEIVRIIQTNENQIVVMGGHKEGILSFGEDLPEAVEVLFSHYNQLKC